MTLEISKKELEALANFLEWARMADDGCPAPRDFFTNRGYTDDFGEDLNNFSNRVIKLNEEGNGRDYNAHGDERDHNAHE
jgi:hypothetical protein